jgi:phosphoribosylformylglycinamidine synthase
MQRIATRRRLIARELDSSAIDLREACYRVLQLPAVADKTFLITIGDRTVSGLIARDQMVGPWQVPVSDVAVTVNSFNGYHGEAMAMGERTPVAVLDAPASGRLAVAEAVTNIAAADIDDISQIKLSANWMAACGAPADDADLFDTVRAVGMELCPELDLTIPVGKDSLSMRSVWQQDDKQREVKAPLSLIISAFARVRDVRRTLTPQLHAEMDDSCLILLDLGNGQNRLGGSALAQVYNMTGASPADLDDATQLRGFFEIIRTLSRDDRLLAYHDRSDGGLFVTLCEMAFASHCGLEIQLHAIGNDPLATLFSEELGAVLHVRQSEQADIMELISKKGMVAY